MTNTETPRPASDGASEMVERVDKMLAAAIESAQREWGDSRKATVLALGIGGVRQYLATLPAAAPAVLKGIGKINGDGWKDTTRKGQVVFVWNDELPAPYSPGQYPRIGSEGWSASTEQYDFEPATTAELRELFAALNPPKDAPGDVAVLEEIAIMMGEFVDNWPRPKRVSTALALIAKTLRAALSPVAGDLAKRITYFVECIAHADKEGWNDATIREARAILAALSAPQHPGEQSRGEYVTALEDALADHNHKLRSAFAIADRNGRDTNWSGFRRQAADCLHEWHAVTNAAHDARNARLLTPTPQPAGDAGEGLVTEAREMVEFLAHHGVFPGGQRLFARCADTIAALQARVGELEAAVAGDIEWLDELSKGAVERDMMLVRIDGHRKLLTPSDPEPSPI